MSADAGLPARTPQELLVALQTAEPTPLSGTVEATTDLGLPELPGMGGPHAATGPTSLISGSNTLRVWSDGPERGRVAMIGSSDEYDIVRNGDDVWTWSSADRAADHYVLPAADHAAGLDEAAAGMTLPSTPQEAADLVLASLDESTDVATSGVGSVAGRPVYELILTPRQADTRVARVAIAVDAETSVPLRVQVFSTQMADPAVEIGFTSVDFSQPDAALFEFAPPPGATVTEHSSADMAKDSAAAEGSGPGADAKPTVVGTGWSQVVIIALPADAMAGLANGEQDDTAAQAMALLQSLPETSGPWGSGRVVDGTLGSVILTDDGRVAIGAVGPETLGAALAAQ